MYWIGDAHKSTTLHFNLATLLASALGQLVFGYFADRYGSKSLYGVELMIVIFSTIGLAQSSVGWMNHSQDKSSMQAHSWIMVWRFVMGIGVGGSILTSILSHHFTQLTRIIGAEYPLSACITAEWSATKSRGRMMAAVFIMQPIGQLVAWAVGMAALQGLSRDYNLEVGILTTNPDEIDDA